MPLNEFAGDLKLNGSFIIKNISDPPKTINIFNTPTGWNKERDLLSLPGIGEADIRASLLKGTLRNKILTNEISIIYSDIDLLQFNIDHRSFLVSGGITKGLQINSSNMDVLHKEDIQLIGDVDDVNTIYMIPDTSFIYDSIYKIVVYKNGVKQSLGDDYTIFENYGPGTGYNGILFSTAPTTIPAPNDILTADYYINNV